MNEPNLSCKYNLGPETRGSLRIALSNQLFPIIIILPYSPYDVVLYTWSMTNPSKLIGHGRIIYVGTYPLFECT